MTYNPVLTYHLSIRNYGRYMMTGRQRTFRIVADIFGTEREPRIRVYDDTAHAVSDDNPMFMILGDDSGSGFRIGECFACHESISPHNQSVAHEDICMCFSAIVHHVCDPELLAPLDVEVTLVGGA